MSRRAKEGAPLAELIRLIVGICQRAEKECPREGPGRPPTIPDWVMATLIMIAVLKRRKSKSAQYRLICQSWNKWGVYFPGVSLPARSTYFNRYRRAYRLLQSAVAVQGRRMIDDGIVDPKVLAVDKSLFTSKGPAWHRKQRERGVVLRGVDRDSQWGFSEHHGWVQGYGAEVVVSAGKRGLVVPLLASVDPANKKEQVSIKPKIRQLPPEMKYLLADSGYDSNEIAEVIEWTQGGKRTGRRYLCRQQRRGVAKKKQKESQTRRFHRERREERLRFFRTPRAKRLFALRGKTVEPFFSWFKTCFDLSRQVHHRGLENNRTQITAAICCYQVLVHYNYKRGHKNGEIQWMLDAL